MELNSGSTDWWLREPFLAFEVSLWTTAGHSWNSDWQSSTDPRIETDIVSGSKAVLTHCTSVTSGHTTNAFSYFRSSGFKENRSDYLERYLVEAKKAGFRTVVYFNVHAIKPDFGADHPEWRQIRQDGSPLDGIYGIETSMCVNTGFRDWIRGVCLDLCEYPIDGIFFDGPVFFAKCCYCDTCRALYRETYGREMGAKETGNPHLAEIARFQAQSIDRLYADVNGAIKEKRSDVALYGNSGAREEPYYVVARNNRIIGRHQDVLAAEGGFLYNELTLQPVWKVGSNCKYYQTQAGGKPTMSFNSAAHGPWRCHTLSDAEMELGVIQAPIHGSGVWFAAFSWIRERSIYPKIADHFSFFRKHREVYFGTRSKARVAILWPEDAVNFYRKPSVLHGDFTQGGQSGEATGDINEEFDGFYDALLRNHVPCDIIDEESVRSENLERYDLILLPNAACTDDRFDERLRDFVRRGGTVIASFETSLCDADGTRRDDFRLADLFGIHLAKSPIRQYPHFYFFGDESALFDGVEQTLLPGPIVSTEVILDGAESLSPYSVKFSGWDGSEILPSGYPAVTMHRYGNGRACYLAGVFGALYWKYKQSDIRRLFANLVGAGSRPLLWSRKLPTSVEVVHKESTSGDSEYVHLINYSGGSSRPFEAISPVAHASIRVRTRFDSARALKAATNVAVLRVGDDLEITLPEIGLFETIVLE